MLGRTVTKQITINEAGRLVGEDTGMILIDARTPGEYASGHIPGSRNIPLGQEYILDNELPEKDTPVFVYCLSGARSSRSQSIYTKLGFTNVMNVGGIAGWKGKLER